MARLRSIIAGSAGNLVEWYDWYAYSTLSLYFAPKFFPASEPTASLLGAAAVFAVGFLARPLGAWWMGVYADRHGRKAGLTLSVVLMCAGSAVIAATPTFASIGPLAPALLLAARVLQGLSVGGEYGASATYLSEAAGPARRGLWSSLQYVTLIAGQLSSLAVLLVLQIVLDREALDAWGWRIPFVVGGALALVVFRLRRGMIETAPRRARDGSSALALVRRHPREAALVLGLTAGGTLAFYTYTTYMQKFLVNTSGFDKTTATRIMTGALALFMIAQPAAGALSDRIGRRPMMIAFGVFGATLTYPLLVTLGETRNAWSAFALVCVALLGATGYTAVNAVVKAELFPAEIRALGVALPYAIANTLFGGTAEYIGLWFKTRDAERGFFVYVSVMCALSLLVYVAMRDTRRASRIGDDEEDDLPLRLRAVEHPAHAEGIDDDAEERAPR